MEQEGGMMSVEDDPGIASARYRAGISRILADSLQESDPKEADRLRLQALEEEGAAEIAYGKQLVRRANRSVWGTFLVLTTVLILAYQRFG